MILILTTVVIGRGPLVVVLEVVIVVWSLLLLEIVVVSVSCSSRVGSVAVVRAITEAEDYQAAIAKLKQLVEGQS